MNSQIRISESWDSEQHNEANREARRGDTQARETRKKKRTPEEEVGRYRSSSVSPDSLPNFLWYEESILSSLIFVENPFHCS